MLSRFVNNRLTSSDNSETDCTDMPDSFVFFIREGAIADEKPSFSASLSRDSA
jgi:hypothetical protein